MSDEQPKTEGDAGTITVKVRNQSGDEMVFKVKKTTKMSKIIDAYGSRTGLQAGTFRFMFDGQRVKDDDTPKMLEMEENDQIDVLIEALGGGDTAADGEVATINIKVKDQSGDEMLFKVKKTTKMSKIMEAYAQRRGVGVENLRFVYDGQRLSKDGTPKMMEMDDEDQIDVTLETVGGL
jgi:small ubiquitin-related modifier